jgi:phosphoribosylanthranilate isomerase
MSFIVKVCGVTRPKDAEILARAGANAIGINFWPGSKRFVEDEKAREIVAALPPGVLKVGVFVNAHPLVVTETLAELGLDMVQLHGDEKVGSWTELDQRRIVRAVRVFDESSFKEAHAWDPGLFIYDAFSESFGGAGVTAPWDLIAKGARHPFLLAGGLTPENVAEAIAATRPDGVDVASGVESAPGVKDPEKMRRFVEAALAAAAAL